MRAPNRLTAVVGDDARVDYFCDGLDRVVSPSNGLFAAQAENYLKDASPIAGQTFDALIRMRFYSAGRYGPSQRIGTVGQAANLPDARQIGNLQEGRRIGNPPHVSIIMPVFNGAALVDRSIRSVAAQTFPEWELIAVDDGSSDLSHDVLRGWAERDPRIRVIRLAENSGLSAARNAALRAAGGQMIAYLDHDDEYFADYLELVMRHRDKGDVLVFGYDIVHEDSEGPHPDPLPKGDASLSTGRVESWDPWPAGKDLFATNPVVPLGIAHRRNLVEKVGCFNEVLWREEDWDYWKRLARVGAEFAFLPLKSGRYHVRRDSLSRVPHLTARQRMTVAANLQAGRPLYEKADCKLQIGEETKIADSPHPNPLPEGEGTKRTHHAPRDEYVRKIAFVSPHCVVDFTNGAARTTLDGLTLLAQSRFECQAFCSSRMDAWEEVLVEEILAQRKVPYAVRNAKIGGYWARMIFTAHGQVPVTLFNTASTRAGCTSAEETAAFLAACEIFLTKDRPDAVWTYGGDPVALAVQKLVKRLDIPILFALHNFAYPHRETFQAVDYAVVPSAFSRRYHWETLGLACQVLPNIVDWKAAEATSRDPRFLTFINPKDIKGVYVFARIARELARRRPDIPILVTQGRSRADALSEPELGLAPHLAGQFPIETKCDGRNIATMPYAPDPRQFYAVTKLLLMPSLCNESFGLVAAEAMLNGIPVLASNRGGLPETIGDAGFLFDIPAKYTPETREVPTAEEVERWVETIIRLWDDAAEYERWSRAARERAQQWLPDRLAPIYREFFTRITHQPGPPLVPKDLVARSHPNP